MRNLLIALIFPIVFYGCGEDPGIVEPAQFVLSGTVTGSETGMPLEGVEVSRYLTGSGDSGFEFFRQAVTDDMGLFHVVLGASLGESRWRFEQAGYTSREFLVPEAATETGSMSFELNVTLEPTGP